METPDAAVAGYLENVGPGPYADAYVPEIVARHGVEALVAAVVRAVRSALVGSPELDGARRALLFVRDVATGWVGPPWEDLVPRFREALPASGLFDALERCLHAPVFATRALAVYSFGKLHFPENVRPLEEALAARRDADPFLVPDLVSEIGWIAADPTVRWALVRQLMASPAELTRWAAVAVLSEHAINDEPAPLVELAAALTRDPSPFVGEEAGHLSASLALDARLRAIPREAWKASRAAAREERTRIEALRPQVTFEDLRARFTAPKPIPFAPGREDYTVDEVLAFLAPLRPPS
jgi:hypothetical protein